MNCDLCGGTVENCKVIYSVEVKEYLHIVENVPARVCVQCGEKLFSHETVAKIQKAIWQGRKPDKIINAPVLDFAAI